MTKPQQITVLGATGSIGLSTLDVVARHPERYQLFALSGFSRIDELAQLCCQHRPQVVVVPDAPRARQLRQCLVGSPVPDILVGEQALDAVAAAPEVDTVMAAIVGAAGLAPTLAAVKAGKRVLLANKEALVMSGPVFMAALAQSTAQLLPIDSEHNAIFQCLPVDHPLGLEQVGVRRILLTASGGPFREHSHAALQAVTPAQACRHPNWSMGRKISVDSASMMNKGLELIEACWLFRAKPWQVEVVVHPQSVIHSMVDYVDGSVLAQMGHPDMRTPIAHALAWPERIDSGVSPLDLLTVAQLDFQAPDDERFPCLALARQAAEACGSAPAILNAANEVAVAAFLAGQLRFTDIGVLIGAVLEQLPVQPVTQLEDVLQADALARQSSQRWLQRYAH